ncbi:MAG: carbohydrate kinase family protein [Coxiellaceae bacterium]|nr:carbohydrate kinase family protein [Coxiellaceae bacterium]
MSEQEQRINQQQGAYAVVIGGSNIDILGEPSQDFMLGDSNPGRVSCSAGGVGRNIAENLARLGSSTYLISAVGKDPHGDLVLRQSQAAGIDMKHVSQIKNASTSTYLSVLNAEREMHVSIADMSILDKINDHALSQHEALLHHAAIIVIDTNLCESALAYLLKKHSHQPIFVDTVSSAKAKKLKPYLAEIHTLKPNLLEAEQLSSIKCEHDSDLNRIANWFHQQGVKRIFITLGERGVYFSDQQQQELLPAVNATIINANGAGDAFIAALAHGWLRQWGGRQCAHYALAAASIALSHVATINPDMSEAIVSEKLKESIC